MTDQSSSSPASTTTSIPRFVPNVPTPIPNPISDLLATYSSLPPSEQPAHLLSVRNRAYAAHPYPCLGRWSFLDLGFSRHPLYERVVIPLFSGYVNRNETNDAVKARTKGKDNGGGDGIANDAADNRPVFLDLGCCLAQDLRKLIYDLYYSPPPLPSSHSTTTPSSPSPPHLRNLYAAELRPIFIDLGYEFFRDESILPRTQFITPANLLYTSDTSDGEADHLAVLDGRVSVLHTGSVFHLFDLETQKKVVGRCLRLLGREGVDLERVARDTRGVDDSTSPSPPTPTPTEGKKALILGSNLGASEPGNPQIPNWRLLFLHDESTWNGMWNEIVSQDEWKGVVKGMTFGNRFLEIPKSGRPSHGLTEMGLVGGGGGESKGEGEGEGEGEEDENMKLMREYRAKLRWHVWWIWVEFV